MRTVRLPEGKPLPALHLTRYCQTLHPLPVFSYAAELMDTGSPCLSARTCRGIPDPVRQSAAYAHPGLSHAQEAAGIAKRAIAAGRGTSAHGNPPFIAHRSNHRRKPHDCMLPGCMSRPLLRHRAPVHHIYKSPGSDIHTVIFLLTQRNGAIYALSQ